MIRPSVWNGKGDERPMLKRKNKVFQQIQGDFDIAIVNKNPILCSNCMMNINRLNGVISKTGPLAERDTIIEEFVQDVWDSLWEMKVIVADYDSVDNHIRSNVNILVDNYIKELQVK